MRFVGKVVAVTGAASGIGHELCRMLALRGAKIAAIDLEQGRLEAVSDEICKSGSFCVAVAADVRHREEMQAAVQEIVGALGPIDIVIPCAGICRASTVDDMKVSEFEEIVRTNFLGTVYLIEAVLPSMLERKRGHIVGLSSLAGVRGIPFEPAYSASKAAAGVYLESLRPEFRSRGVAVTTVFPGYVQTPLLEKINGSMGADMSNGKALTAAAAAATIMRAIERRSAYVYFPLSPGLSVRVSQILPSRLYDRFMERMSRRLPISRLTYSAPNPDKV